jgi:hypothetical protein
MNITYFVKSVVATHLGVLLPDLSMLSTQDLGVEITIVLSGDAGIGLPADLDTLVIGEVDVFTKESALSGYKGMRLAVGWAVHVDVIRVLACTELRTFRPQTLFKKAISYFGIVARGLKRKSPDLCMGGISLSHILFWHRLTEMYSHYFI